MNFRIRNLIPQDLNHTRVGNDERIDGNIPNALCIIPQRLDVIVVGVDINGHVTFCIVLMKEVHSLPHFIQGKVPRSRPKAEHLASEIYRIGTVSHRRF